MLMRFLLRERPEENVIAEGRFAFASEGKPLEQWEMWRLTQLPTRDVVLRVDVDERATTGESLLFHALLSAEGEPQRYLYQHFSREAGGITRGELLFGESLLHSYHALSGDKAESFPAQAAVFRSIIGMGLLARLGGKDHGPSVALLDRTQSADPLQLITITPQIIPQRTRDLKRVRVGETLRLATTVTLRWGDISYLVWLDTATRWPLQVQGPDGLEACETRLMWHLHASPEGKTLPTKGVDSLIHRKDN